jgi:hypothetical protein
MESKIDIDSPEGSMSSHSQKESARNSFLQENKHDKEENAQIVQHPEDDPPRDEQQFNEQL